MKFELQKVIPNPLKEEIFSSESVWDSELTIESPEKILLNAHSGKGKSTFVHLLYGLRSDFSGAIFVNGTKTSELEVHDWIEWRRKELSFIPQDLQLFPELSVMENLQLKNQLTDYATEHEIKELLNRLGISDKIEQKCGTLSMGQQQRVTIIRALLQPFEFLLMDEPFSHLDEGNTQIALELINEKSDLNSAGFVLTSLGSGHNFEFQRELFI
jgi:ABC-type lipoprotein export system ATPase subunit